MTERKREEDKIEREKETEEDIEISSMSRIQNHP